MDFIIENLGTVITAAVIIGIVAIVVAIMINDKKKGKSSCGCNCADCPMSGKCHTK